MATKTETTPTATEQAIAAWQQGDNWYVGRTTHVPRPRPEDLPEPWRITLVCNWDAAKRIDVQTRRRIEERERENAAIARYQQGQEEAR